MATVLELRPPDAAPSARATTRVLHVINGEHYAGAERVQDLLALRLPELGFRVDFACLKPGSFADARQSRDAPVYELPMRSRFDLGLVRRLARLIRRQGYQIVHAHTPRSLLMARLAVLRSGVPVVYHVHSPAARDTTHRVRNRVNAAVERMCMTGGVPLVAVSASLKKYLEGRGIKERRIHVVHNGVPGPDALAQRLAPRGPWTVGTVALMRPRKGIEVLIDAAARVRAAGGDIRLRLVGACETADYEAELKRRIAERGLASNVDWTGFTRDVPAELQRMDLFVLPSLFGEGLPMVVLEAMAWGVPVIASRVEGIPEAVRDGRDGLLVPPDRPDALFSAIGRVMNNAALWSQLRTSAAQRHALCFSDRAMASGVAEVYQRILASVPHPGK